MNYTLKSKAGQYSKGYYYPVVQRGATLTTDQLAQRIQERCTVTRPDIKAVLDALVTAMQYSLQSGEKVHIEGLGYFYLNILAKGADKKEDYDITKYIKSIRCRFLPDSTRDAASGNVTRTFCSGVTLRKVDDGTESAEAEASAVSEE